MNDSINDLTKQFCKALCTKVTLKEREDGNIFVMTPFVFPDGDSFSMYLKRLPSGGFRLSDMGSTMMHLSYEQDVEKLRDGTRGKIFAQSISEMGIADNEGELYLEVPASQLPSGLFKFGQALRRVHDLTFLNRVRVEDTFYEDLKAKLTEIVGQNELIPDYVAPGVQNAEEYIADFCVKTTKKPVLIWGVQNQAKARLAMIVIQHLRQYNFSFRSFIVYSDMTSIPRQDISRLTTAANDQISSITETAALRSKLLDAITA
jgi:hypothetical protein